MRAELLKSLSGWERPRDMFKDPNSQAHRGALVGHGKVFWDTVGVRTSLDKSSMFDRGLGV